jgi:hypothetical protein
VVGHGVVLNGRVEVAEMVGIGLSPPAPNWVEPIGIPTRPRGATDTPVGDEADAAGPANEPVSIGVQVPDAVPARPPPSNAVVDVEVPAVETPVPYDVPPIEPAIPEDKLPAPGDSPGAELPIPYDDSGIAPPWARHAGLVTVVPTAGDAPEVSGLTPGS